MAIVVLNPTGFLQRYPEFSNVDPSVLPVLFNEACAFCNNTDASPVTDVTLRATLLNMLTAHIVFLNFGSNATPATSLVGRISSASEGSVHATADMGKPSAYAAWFMQTKYGAAYWQATKQYRMMHYVHPCWERWP